MPVAQVNNPQMIDILSSKFQDSSDPSFQHRIAISKYLNLPGSRGFWGPAVRMDTQGGGINITDMTGGGYHMPWVHYPVLYPVPGALAWFLDGVNDWTSYPDCLQFDILANEAWIAYPGIALGCWIYPQRVYPYGTSESIISKWAAAAPNVSYLLFRDTALTGNISFALSDNGVNVYLYDHTKVLTPNKWYFVAVTYNPGAIFGEPAGVRIWINDTMQYHAASDRGTVGLPASIANSNAVLMFGNGIGVTTPYLGSMTNWFICGNYLLEAEIYNIWESTKYMFGFANEKGTSY